MFKDIFLKYEYVIYYTIYSIYIKNNKFKINSSGFGKFVNFALLWGF